MDVAGDLQNTVSRTLYVQNLVQTQVNQAEEQSIRQALTAQDQAIQKDNQVQDVDVKGTGIEEIEEKRERRNARHSKDYYGEKEETEEAADGEPLKSGGKGVDLIA